MTPTGEAKILLDCDVVIHNNTEDKRVDLRNAPLMSQNEISEADCNWRDLASVKHFTTEREKSLKAFISNEFDV
jgi:hypothetical protein